MSFIPSILNLWEDLKNCIFQPFFKNSFFNKDFPPVDDFIGETWRKIFLTLWTQDSEYLTDILKFFWEHWEPHPNLQVAKIDILGIFSLLFLSLKTPCYGTNKSNLYIVGLGKITLVENNLAPSEVVSKQSSATSLNRGWSCFFKKDRKHYFWWLWWRHQQLYLSGT